MITQIKKKVKSISVTLLAGILMFNTLSLPDLTYAAGGTDPSWTQDALDAAVLKNYIPTVLSYKLRLHIKCLQQKVLKKCNNL